MGEAEIICRLDDARIMLEDIRESVFAIRRGQARVRKLEAVADVARAVRDDPWLTTERGNVILSFEQAHAIRDALDALDAVGDVVGGELEKVKGEEDG